MIGLLLRAVFADFRCTLGVRRWGCYGGGLPRFRASDPLMRAATPGMPRTLVMIHDMGG